MELEAEAKNILLLPHTCSVMSRFGWPLRFELSTYHTQDTCINRLVIEAILIQGCGSGKFLQKRTLKKGAGSGSELRSIWFFEEPEAEAFFIKHVEAFKFLRNRKHFEERSWKLKQTRKRLYMELEAEAKNILLLPHTCLIYYLLPLRWFYSITYNPNTSA